LECQRRADEALRGGRRERLGSGYRLLGRRRPPSLPGQEPFSGDFSGKEAFLERYGRLSAELGGTIELAEVHEVLLGAEHVVALVRERAVRGERSLEFERVNVYSCGGGKITEIWTYDYDPCALEEFWS